MHTSVCAVFNRMKLDCDPLLNNTSFLSVTASIVLSDFPESRVLTNLRILLAFSYKSNFLSYLMQSFNGGVVKEYTIKKSIIIYPMLSLNGGWSGFTP